MNRKEKILKSAYENFSESGYFASLNDIAKDAGIQKPTIYNYFQSKDNLFYEMIKIEISNYFSSRMKEFNDIKSDKVEDQLKNIFFMVIKYFKDKKEIKFWRWILFIDSNELRDKARDIIRSEEKNFLHLLINVFEVGVKKGEIKDQPIRPLIHTYIALIHGTLDGVLLYEGLLNLDTFSNNVWNTFWNGISNNQQS